MPASRAARLAALTAASTARGWWRVRMSLAEGRLELGRMPPARLRIGDRVRTFVGRPDCVGELVEACDGRPPLLQRLADFIGGAMDGGILVAFVQVGIG